MDRYGRWTVLREFRKNGKKYYECRCDCGEVKEVYYRSIETGTSQSCGCLRSELNREKGEDFTGKKFGKLTVLCRDAGRFGYWICVCECGGRKSIVGHSLREGNTRSCGCIHRERASEVGTRTVAKNSEVQIQTNRAYRTNFQVIESKTPPRNNKSGHKGVWWNEKRGMWEAYIQIHGKRKNLGRYYRKEEAIAARVAAEEEYFEPLIVMKKG